MCSSTRAAGNHLLFLTHPCLCTDETCSLFKDLAFVAVRNKDFFQVGPVFFKIIVILYAILTKKRN